MFLFLFFFCDMVILFFFFFFFQAEDGIRDRYVTGVQTCALPISIPRCATRDSGRASTGSARSANAACATGRDSPHSRAACATVRPSSATRPAACPRSRVVTRQRGGTAGSDSVKLLRSHETDRHSHRRFTHTTAICPRPWRRSAGCVVTYPLTCADTVPHPGHAAAPRSSVTTHTVRPPPAPASTSATAVPSSANSRVAISWPKCPWLSSDHVSLERTMILRAAGTLTDRHAPIGGRPLACRGRSGDSTLITLCHEMTPLPGSRTKTRPGTLAHFCAGLLGLPVHPD